MPEDSYQYVDLGYAKDRLFLMRVDVQMAGYEEHRRLPLFQRLLERVRAVPGVLAASYSKSCLFLGSRSSGNVEIEGYSAERGSGVKSVGSCRARLFLETRRPIVARPRNHRTRPALKQ